ncbi:MAG: 5-histidylcysteine sulfoxide synthase [Cellvibrionaceae bacterium]
MNHTANIKHTDSAFHFSDSQLLITKTILLSDGDPEKKRQEIRNYFHKTFTLYERLFDCLVSDESYYQRGTPLRHPLIFYYGHTAVFYINKLHVAKLIPERLDATLESMVAIGVDEMSWDDLDENHYDWPTPQQVKQYRNHVRSIVDEFIQTAPITLPITWDDPLWIVMMGIEHERIHLETSSVLIRQLPIQYVQSSPLFLDHTTTGAPAVNFLLPVDGQTIHQNKTKDNPLYGWDNEYGDLTTSVKDFKASQYLVSNHEFLEFIQDDGYQDRSLWNKEGWAWVEFSHAEHPTFWIKKGEQFHYRTMTQIIPMPWDWPVDVNYLEAKAFCEWKKRQTGKKIRLPTEAEWYCLRNEIKTDQPFWKLAPGNINLEHGASACPIDTYKTEFENGSIFYDVIGNVWQWTETPIDGLPGFDIHPVYDDFSTPTFDGKHNLIKGGSYFSTGNYAIKDSRYAFRRHFFQHAGFRYVESDSDIDTTTNPYETDEQVSQYLEFHYGKEYYDVPNFAKACAQHCIDYSKKHLNKDTQFNRALDLGCAVGRSSFELANLFSHVDALDFSARFISAAAELQKNGLKRYTTRDEGEIFSFYETRLSDLKLDKNAKRCHFLQGDACNLNEKFKHYNLIFAGNLIDRLYEPEKFLASIHERLEDNGLLILTSPYTWLEEFTPKEKWIGGYKRDGENYTTLDGLKDILGKNFTLIDDSIDVPFVIRETARKFQHTNSQMTVWQKMS